MGLANYGRSDAPAMPYTGFKGESGFLSYYEACLMLSCEKWKEFWNDKQDVPFAKGKENYPWAGYDNVKSMQIKAKYVQDNGLLGAMFWTVIFKQFIF
jgi:chitinase